MNVSWILSKSGNGLQANLQTNEFYSPSACLLRTNGAVARSIYTTSLGMCVDVYLQNVFPLFKSQHFCTFFTKFQRKRG